MSDSAPPRFLWSDAWLLLAVGIVSPDGGAAPLPEVLGAADGVQHAILTREELNGAIGRLGHASLLTYAAGALALTSGGRDLVARSERVGRAVLKQQEALERLLGAAPWEAGHHPRRAGEGQPEVITQDEYDEALQSYYKEVGFKP